MSTPGKSAKSPSVPTLKKLFATSGNMCAFPSCSTPACNLDTDSIDCEVCHICARNPGGPRFNTEQDENARHGFDNLILLCGTHHKQVDEDSVFYTVDRLLEMKAEKRSSNKSPPFSEEKLQELAERLRPEAGPILNQSHGNTFFGSGAHVSMGISYDDAKRIVNDAFEANAAKYVEQAAAIAGERASQLAKDYIDRLQTESISPEVLLDPDVQYAVVSAQRAAARRGERELSGLLVDLLVARVRNKEDNLMKVVLNEAIELSPKLAPDQFDTLSLIFVLRHNNHISIRGINELRLFLDTTVAPLLASASSSDANFRHLQYCGCVSPEPAINSLPRLFAALFPHVFITDIPKARIMQYLGGDCPAGTELLSQFFLRGEGDNIFSLNQAALLVAQMPNIDPQFSCGLRLSPEALKSLLRQLTALAEHEIHDNAAFIESLVPLKTFWEERAYKVALTSVGIAIAHANLLRRRHRTSALSTWIH